MKRWLLLVPFLAAACGSALAATDSPFDGLGPDAQVFVVDRNGHGLTTITRDDRGHYAPAWSRTGWLAFVSSSATSNAIETVQPDGADRRVLVEHLAGRGLAWSPDGRRLAYTTYSEAGSRQRLETVSADGSGPELVAEFVVPRITVIGPSWSRDGTKLAYARGFGTGPPGVPPGQPALAPAIIPGSLKIVVADAAGRSERRLTQLAGDEWDPQWSPRAHTILFARQTGRGRAGLFVASPGRGPRLLVGNLLSAVFAAWSPDGRRVAFIGVPWVSDRIPGLYLVDVRTRRVRKLTDSVATLRPSWSPDGRLIAFAARDGVRVVSPAGDAELLLPVSAQVPELAWSPDGTLLAFTAQRVPEG